MRTGHGHSTSMLYKWNMINSPNGDCGVDNQTIDGIVNECEHKKFDGGMNYLHHHLTGS